MRKELLFLLLMAFIYTKAQAQTGIGTTTPNADAALEIKSTNKGVLIPRLPLESTTSPAPLSAHVAGMLIYNTATSGSAPNNVNPGSYFNDGTKWVRVANAADGDKTDDAWINEYSDDDDATNDLVKLGTLSDGTTARPLGTEFVAKDNGRVGIGTNNPDWQLHVEGDRAIGLFKRITTGASNNAPGFLFTRARGSLTEQSDINEGDFLGKIQFRGRVGNVDEDYATLGYIANSNTAIGNGHFAFFKGVGGSEIMTIHTNTSNVGINEAAPSAKLEVNGNVEISTIDNVGNDISYKPLVWNSVTHRVESSPNNGSNINKKITVNSGATAAVHTLTVTGSGAYDVKVLAYNGCGATAYNKFILAGLVGTTTAHWTINHVAGTSENGASTVDASSTKTSKYIHNPLSGGCGDGGNGTALDFTLSVNSSTAAISIKNNGNIPRDYYVVIEKAFD